MKKTLLVLALASTATYGAWKWHKCGGGDGASAMSEQGAPGLAFDRFWIDHMPRNERDTVQIFAAVKDDAFGVFQSTSSWAGQFEAFRFEANGNEMRILYPQTGDKDKVRLKADDCHEGDFDYCLDIKGNSRGVGHYFSREGWEIGNVHSAAELHDRVLAILAAEQAR